MKLTWAKVKPKQMDLVAIQYAGYNKEAICEMFWRHKDIFKSFEIQETYGFETVNGEQRRGSIVVIETLKFDGVRNKLDCIEIDDYIVLNTSNGDVAVYEELEFAKKFMPAD